MANKIVVTGASSQIGQEICKKILSNGDEAILQCFKNKDNCLPLKKKIGNNCKIFSVDFCKLLELDDFCKQLSDTDILINTAASTKTGILGMLDDNDVSKMIQVNIIAIIKLCKAVIPGMVIRRKGCIINISSVAAQRGNRGQTVYAGTKGFVESFSRSMAAEYGAKGIRVNCVAPGPIDAGSLKELLGYAEDEVNQSIVSGRLGKPEDVASIVSFLCSNEASFINGRCIPVDGGFCKGV